MAGFGKSLSFSGGTPGANAQGGTSSGGSLFGGFNQTANPAGGSLFGTAIEKRQRSGTATDIGTSAQQGGTAPTFGQAAGGSGGGLFGNTAQASTGSSLFGNNAQAPAGGSLFGNTQSGGGGPFGGNPGAATMNMMAQNTTSSGIFGNTSGASGLFGSSTAASQPAQMSSLFGAAPAAAPSGGLFGGGGQFQQQQQQQPASTQQQQPSEAEELSRQLLIIKECWDPASPHHQFRHYFYNVAEPGQAHLYQCPADQDPTLWQQAQSDNPDPQTLVPVLANGFDDLRKRVDSQSLQMQSYQARTEEVSDKLCGILQKHHSGTTVRLSECRRRQAELSQRLL
ncbi:Nucleoporin nup57, partial [Kickxella alabastrina]